MRMTVKQSAHKFGAKVVDERFYTYAAGSRRTDTGHQQVQQQLPLVTQSAPPYDVVFVADESQVFGEYMPYRTWDPRPVVGTAGLIAVRLGIAPTRNMAARNCRTASSARSGAS